MIHRRAAAFWAVAALVLSFAVATPAHAATVTTYYVDPVSGNNANAGKSVSTAFRTIDRAQNVVRAAVSSVAGDIEVRLRGGSYPLASTVRFGSADSGRNGHKVVWKAYPGETPVLTSARRITGWTAAAGGMYKAPIGNLNFRQLYVNGIRAAVARYPDAGTHFQLKTVDKANQRLGISPAQISNWAKFTNVRMVLQLQWAENYLPLQSYNVSNGVANVAFRQPIADILFPRPFPLLANGSPFHFENALEFVNQPGEFYVDTAAQSVYYLPRPGESLATANVTVPTLQTLVDIAGSGLSNPVHDLRVEGLTFADTTWTLPASNGMINAQGGNYNVSADTANRQYVARPPAGVHVAYADRITFTGNTFTRMGSTGLDLDHAVHDSSVVGNLVRDTAGNGIMIGKFSDPSVEYHTVYNPPVSPPGESILEVVKRVDVSNNLIQRTGQDYYGTAGINAGFVNSTTITHNDISDVSWAGVSLGWGWQSAANALGNNQVSYNHIHDVMNVLCDAAGIYHLSNDPGTTMTGNYIHDVVRSPTACGSAVAGFYLDEGSNNMSVTGNVIANTSGVIQQNVNGSAVTLSGNATSGADIIAAAGLQSPYTALRGRVNLAYGKTTTASSTYAADTTSAKANDNDLSTGWSPTAADTAAWWQVDLGTARALGEVTVTARQDLDQAATRSGFEIRASNDAAFTNYVVLDRQDSRGLAHRGSRTIHVVHRTPYRYLRIAKTDGQYFYLADVTATAGDGVVPARTALAFDPAVYYTLTNVNSGKVLDVSNNSTADGGVVDQWTGNGGNNQQWQILPVSGDLFRIVNRNSGKALDVPYFSRDKGTQLDQWSVNSGNNQLWYFDTAPDGNRIIRSLENQQVLDVTGAATTDGAAVSQYTPLGQTNQQWAISPAPAVAITAGADATVAEGSTISLTGAAGDPSAALAWSAAAGSDVDAGGKCTFTTPNALVTGITCTDDGTYTVALTAGANRAQITVSVTNVAPKATAPTKRITPNGPVAAGTPVRLTVPVSDAGSNDTLSCRAEWGNRSVTKGSVSGSTCTITTKTTPVGTAVRPKIIVDDLDGGTSSVAMPYVVTYVRKGGYVAGSGWLPSSGSGKKATGDIEFAFIDRVRANGGSTFVRFGPNLTFTSTSQTRAKVTGRTTATFAGLGRINGTGTYRFSVNVTDGRRGSPDRFSMTIYNKTGKKVLYRISGGRKGQLAGGAVVISLP